MAKLNKIEYFLNELLNSENIEDSSNNGVQVETRKEIKKIAFAVDGCIEVFEKAKKEKCDLVIVHHGISWKDNLKKITNNNYERISYLIKNDIGLVAYHIPLDKHEKYGNNIKISKLLKLKKIKEFGSYNGTPIGYVGKLPKKTKLNDFIEKLYEIFDNNIRVLDFGRDNIESVAIVSGGGNYALNELITKDYDCLICGEGNHSDYHEAKEGKINLIIAGHYATETFGVKALMPLLEKKFGVKTVFIDVPTGL